MSIKSILLACLLTSGLAAVETVERRNVILICLDDLRPSLGCYGDRVAITPAIDQIARDGVVFERAYTQLAVCSPSRNSLLTGLRPDHIGIYDLQTNFREGAPDAVTIGQTFQAAGWRCESVGKVYHTGHGNHDDAASWSSPPPKIDYSEPQKPTSAPDEAGKRPAYSWPDIPDSETHDGRAAAAAISRINAFAHDKTPFFLAVGFAKPHWPYYVPKRYWDMHDPAKMPVVSGEKPPVDAPPWSGSTSEARAFAGMPALPAPIPDDIARTMMHGYYASTTFADVQVGKVLAAVKAAGIEKQTIIVVWGDHGLHLGEQGWWGKCTNYEMAVRTPLVIKAPGLAAGVRTNSLAATLDIYPTLCELAGVKPPEKLDGHSLVPVLRDPSAKVQDSVISMFPKSIRGAQALGRTIRTERWRYVEWRKFDTERTLVGEELYDLADTPIERTNVAAVAANAGVLAGLREQMARYGRAADMISVKPAKGGGGGGD